jgi:Na+-transporting NADH:ubiquinone oxidoreductase subunit A
MTDAIHIRKGLDIPVAGEPQQQVHEGAAIKHVALCGPDYVGLRPRLLVEVGDSVGVGQPLFEDKRDPAVCYASPGRGTVVAINRGARRALQTVVVGLGDANAEDLCFDTVGERALERLSGEELRRRLLRSGLWTALRTRPFSRVPESGTSPCAIFVTAIDTRPLAADPEVIISRDVAAFTLGLRVLCRLTAGAVYLCTGPDWQIPISGPERLRKVIFSGPHPAGLAGTHIHFLEPVGPDRTAWHIGFQDVLALGRLFRTGRIDNERIIAVAGPCVREPRLLTTRQGCSLHELLRGELQATEACRVISGSVLGGRAAIGHLAFLGHYHDQVSVVAEGGESKVFGWAGLQPSRFTAAGTFSRTRRFRRRFPLTTSQNGRFAGMLPVRVFDRVMPLDILPSPLFRALLVKDTERAQALGCLELDEEDLALSSFVCPAKQDYGAALRINLDLIEREGG